MSDLPEDLLYSRDHEWVSIDGDTATVGITEYAQDQLGDITYVDLPEIGHEIEQFNDAAVVESTKAATDIYAPLSGKVVEVNGELEDHAEVVNQDPYGDGWLMKIKYSNPAEQDSLMGAAAYEEFLDAGGDEH
jgi:glycine cleavage system H protein|tara:strand:- start:76 stop:474 length:399 start_codon:yes stop_codon:yes gene_type:complete